MAGLNIGELFVRLSADPSGLKKGISEGQTAVERGVASMTGALKTLGVSFGAGLFLRSVIKNSEEAQAAMAQLGAVVKSTAGVAGKSVRELDAMSNALQKTTTFSDEAVKGAEALLLTFTNIKGDTFDRATRAVLDLATAMAAGSGGTPDLKSASIQLGKALNDPIKGLTALTKVGVSFTEGQREVIKSMVKTGDIAGAQAVILQELEREFAGSAAAARNTLGGALKALGNQWGELLEVGKSGSAGIVGAINTITDALPHLRNAFDDVFKAIQNFALNIRILIAGTLQLAGETAKHIPILSRWAQGWRDAGDAIEKTNDLIAGAVLGVGQFARMGQHDSLTGHLKDDEAAAAALTEQLKEMNAELKKAVDALPTLKEIDEHIARPLSSLDIKQNALMAKGLVATAGAAAGGGAATIKAPAIAPFKPNAFTGGKGEGEGASTISKVVGKLADFGKAIGGILSALNPWKLLLDAIGRALGDFIANMTPIVELLATALMPILKALFPIFKLMAIAATYVGQVFFTIADGILKAVGYLIKGLGTFIDKIPFLGDFGLKKAGQGLIDLANGFGEAADGLGAARDEIKTLEWKDASDAVTDLGDAAQKTAEMLTNIPEIWNVNLARFRAQAAVGGTLATTGSTGNMNLLNGNLAKTLNTFTGNIVLPGVKNAKEFYEQMSAEAVRLTARGGTPIIPDFSQGG